MAQQFILDGYNILHQMPFESSEGIDVLRTRLIDQIETRRPHGSRNNDLTIVFDGRPGPAYTHRALSVKIVFSLDESADDVIVRRVMASKNPKTVTVVTDDRAVQSQVKMSGATVMSVGEFLRRLQAAGGISASSKQGVRRAAGETGKYISKTTEFAINEELREIWLKPRPEPPTGEAIKE